MSTPTGEPTPSRSSAGPASTAGARASVPRVQTLSRAEIDAKLAGLRADLLLWQQLQDRWGTVEQLESEIRTYQWLRGDD